MILAQNYSQLTLRNTPHTKIHPYTRYKKMAGCACAGNAGTFSPPPFSKETARYRSRHASRHVRDARAVMHVGIVDPRWRGNVPGIPGACAIRNFTYLVRAPYYHRREEGCSCCTKSTILSQHCIVTFGWCHISFVFFHSSALDSVNNTDDIVYLHASCF